jgi:hypothetical protein
MFFALLLLKTPPEPVPSYRVEVGIAAKAQMRRENPTLILDSGATHMVLFRVHERLRKSARCRQRSVEGRRHRILPISKKVDEIA